MSSESETDTPPVPKKKQVLQDEDEDDSSDEDYDAAASKNDDSNGAEGGKSSNRDAQENDDDSEEDEDQEDADDDDDSDEDEEEEEDVTHKKGKDKGSKQKEKHKSSRDKGKKRKRTKGGRRHRGESGRSRYVDSEANVGGDEEDDDDGDYEITEAEANKLAKEAYKPRQKSAFEANVLAADDAEVEEYYRQRARPIYGERAIYENARGGKGTAVVKQAIMPAPGVDPSMWRIKTRPGKETYVIMSVMNMAVRLSHVNQRVGITSAVYGGGNGVVYIEAYSESDVSACVSKLQQLLSRKPELISYGIMPEVMDVGEKLPKIITDGQWVRLKRGLYKGDLARVVGVVESGDKYLIELIPRIDYTTILREGFRSQNFYIAKKGSRPEQRFFDPADAKKNGIRVDEERMDNLRELGKGDMYVWRMYLNQTAGNDRFRSGYLLKAVKAATQLETDVTVDPEEVQRFGAGALADELDENERQAKMDEATRAVQTKKDDDKKTARRFNLNDRVVVIKGELRGLEGIVGETNINSGTVSLMGFRRAGMPSRVDVQASDLAHYIEVGSHVKVIDGVHGGVTGMVQAIKVDPEHGTDIVYIMTDLEQTEITVRRDQVKITEEQESGYSEEAGLAAFTLVQFDANRVGMVLRLFPGMVVVLDQDNNEQTLDRRSVTPFQSRHSSCTDRNNNTLRVGDPVEIDDRSGGQRIRGTIKHIYMGSLWITSKQVAQHNGYMVTRASNVNKEGFSRAGRNKPTVFNAVVNNTDSRNGGYGNRGGGAGFGGRGGGGGGRGGGGRGMQHPLVGKEVKIRGKTEHKGKTGKVKFVNDGKIGVEVNKVNTGRLLVMLTEDQIVAQEDMTSGGHGGGGYYGGRQSYGGGGRTPAMTPGGQTPGLGGMTPGYGAYGGQTPGYGSMTPGLGGMTPGYGAVTPSHYGAGNQTPSHYGSGRSPGRDGGRSPYHN